MRVAFPDTNVSGRVIAGYHLCLMQVDCAKSSQGGARLGILESFSLDCPGGGFDGLNDSAAQHLATQCLSAMSYSASIDPDLCACIPLFSALDVRGVGVRNHVGSTVSRMTLVIFLDYNVSFF